MCRIHYFNFGRPKASPKGYGGYNLVYDKFDKGEGKECHFE
jgi:hypothetical protein